MKFFDFPDCIGTQVITPFIADTNIKLSETVCILNDLIVVVN